jgi:RNA polymerase sigma factor (sigma-70 family)
MHADTDLVTRWRGGDNTAGHALFARHFDSLYRFFRTKCGGDADELVQTTLLACIGARDQFRGEASFRTYLFVIARQKLHRFFTTRPRFDPMISSVAEVATSVRTVIARDQMNAVLVGALQQLPLDWQTLLELHYWEGIDTIRLAEIFDVPKGTIRVWLHRTAATVPAQRSGVAASRCSRPSSGHVLRRP